MPADPATHYGVRLKRQHRDLLDLHVEALENKGYTVLNSGLGEADLRDYRARLDALLEQQTAAAGGQEALAAIGEANTVRAPLAMEDRFLALATQGEFLAVIARLLGDYFILSQQNGIVVSPSAGAHHQSAYHRDLPYQHFTSSRPLAISALFCLDEFTSETGATLVIPGSQQREEMPSESYARENEIAVRMTAGSILLFDAMLFHRAGENVSTGPRRAVNCLYTLPILKQQISLPSLLKGKGSQEPALARLLGYESETAASVEEFRARRRPVKSGT